MKITHRKIQAATSSVKIPAPFDLYYRIVSPEELAALTGMDLSDLSSPAEECEGYDVTHLAWAVPKDEYEDYFADAGLDVVELVQDPDYPDERYLAYVVGGRLFSVDDSDLPVEKEDFNRDDTAMAIAEELGIDDGFALTIYDWYKAEGAFDDFETMDQFLDFLDDDIYDMLDACDDPVIRQHILDAIEGTTDVRGAIDTGLEYWYFTRHGLGPGMMPKGVNIVDTYEEGWDTWFKTDKLLTTEELNEYEIKEQWPPEGVTTNHGEVIQSCSSITSATCKQVGEDENTLRFVVSSQDDADLQDVEGRSLVRYKGFRLLNSPDKAGWNIIDEDGKQVGNDFGTEKAARRYIDEHCEVEADTNIDVIDTNQLEHDINEGCIQYLTGPEGGFSAPGTPKESQWDITADEIYTVEISHEGDRIKVEVRAELDYNGLENLISVLDPIIATYDPDSYFEPVTSGIIDAYITDNSYYSDLDSYVNSACINDKANIDASSESHLDSEKYYEPEPDVTFPPFDLEDIEFNGVIEVKDGDVYDAPRLELNKDFSEFNQDYLDSIKNQSDDLDDLDTDFAPTDDSVKDDIVTILSTMSEIPHEDGYYNVTGDIEFEYAIQDLYTPSPKFVQSNSKINNLVVTKADKPINSSTDVNAAMTEEDLDYAIENGKGFDLESFKKYKLPQLNPNIVTAGQLDVGDVVKVTEDASEVNLGTVVKILAINDPAESWIEYTFRVEIVEDPGKQSLTVGDVLDLHFDGDEPIGQLVLN